MATAVMGTRMIRFAIVGISGIGVNMAALAVLHQLVGLPLLAASPLAVELAIANNFVWNNRWTFEEHGTSLWRFARFNLASLAGLVVATGTLYCLVRYANLYYLFANLIGVGLASALNFCLSQFWAWGPSR